MADTQEPQGGLAAAVERPAGMDEYSKARAALVEQQNKLLASLEERNKPQAFDFWASLARGFADPNAKLFSQGLGAGVGNLQDMNERDKAKEMQMYQIRSQVAQQQLEMQRQAMMSGLLQKEMFGGDRVNPSEALNIAKQAGAQRGPTEQAATLIGAPKQTETQSLLNSLDPATKRMLVMQSITNPDKAAEALSKFGIEVASKNLVKPDAVRALEYYVNLLPKESQPLALQVAAKAQLYGKTEDIAKAMAEAYASNRAGNLPIAKLNLLLEDFNNRISLTKIPNNAGGVSNPVVSSTGALPARSVMAGSPDRVRASLGSIENPAQRREALNAYEDQLGSSGQFFTSTAPTNNSAGVPLPPITREKVAAEIATTTGQERAKSDQKLYDESQSGSLSGRQLANHAKNLYSIVDTNPDAFKVLTGTGLGAGLVRLFDDTFQVGEYRAGMPAFRAALGQVIRSKDQQEAFIAAMQSRQFINAAITAEQNKGQGSVSNIERLMYADAGAGNADTPAMLKYKAEFLMAKGQFNEFLHKKMHEARANGISPSDFINSPQYQQYWDDYDKSLMKIRSVYIK